MTFDRRALAAALASLLLVAACGGGATPAPSATAVPTDAPPTATDTPTNEPTETQEPSETDTPVQPGAAPDLEAMLPSEVGGVQFERASFDGSTFPGGIPIGEGDEAFEKFLADNGKTINDLRMAIASPIDSDSAGSLVMALQVKGVPGDKLAEFALADMTDAEQTTIGGKTVYGAGMSGFGAYVYIKDDVVFYVLVMGGPDLAEGIFAALP